jgi:hypothetical protein
MVNSMINIEKILEIVELELKVLLAHKVHQVLKVYKVKEDLTELNVYKVKEDLTEQQVLVKYCQGLFMR